MTRKFASCVLLLAVALLFLPGRSFAQREKALVSKGHVVIPESSVAQPGDVGLKAHTHLRLFVPPAGMSFGSAVQPKELPPFPGYFFETPASLGCIYHLVSHSVPGCNPNVTTENPNIGKGARAIALVDAFDDPNAVADLTAYSAQFGLPAPNLTVVFANGVRPQQDPTGGWEVEESLDIEIAHAMAPGAQLYLVEAADNSFTNLFQAVTVASGLVAGAGGGEISMSWGGGEFGPALGNSTVSEAVYDSFFNVPGIVFFASSGDSPGVEYPSASPKVVSAGGTTISRDPNFGNFLLENTWQDAGSGPSQIEPRPAFQNGVAFIVGDSRGTPDLSFDANPTTGLWVLDSNTVPGPGWYIVGGTSVASPALAGIVNAAESFRGSSPAENTELYNHLFSGVFNSITYGNCGLNAGTFGQPGYDLCTGLGSVNTLRDK
jgi:kumamolisin